MINTFIIILTIFTCAGVITGIKYERENSYSDIEEYIVVSFGGGVYGLLTGSAVVGLIFMIMRMPMLGSTIGIIIGASAVMGCILTDTSKLVRQLTIGAALVIILTGNIMHYTCGPGTEVYKYDGIEYESEAAARQAQADDLTRRVNERKNRKRNEHKDKASAPKSNLNTPNTFDDERSKF